MKRLLCGGLIILLCFMSGCLKAHTLDKYGYVMAIGMDVGDTMPYHVTLMLQKTQSGSDTQTSGGFTLVDAESRSLFEAIETLAGSLPFQLDFARTALIVVGLPLAQREGEIQKLLDISYAQLRIRYNANLMLALESAQDAMKGLENELDPNLSKLQENFVTYSHQTGLSPIMNLTMMDEAMRGKCFDPIIPLCGKIKETEQKTARGDSVGISEYPYIGGMMLVTSGMKTGLAGSVLMANGKTCGILDGMHTQLVLMASGMFRKGRMQLEDRNGQNFSIVFTAQESPVTQISLRKDLHFARVSIPLIADIEQPEQLIGDSMQATEEWLEQTLSSRTQQVYACCRAMGTDCFGFGKSAIKLFSSSALWDQYDWKTAYKSLDVEFIYEVALKQDPKKSVLE